MIKNKKIEDVLRFGLGIIFLSAAFYRIFNFDKGISEIEALGLSSHFLWGVIGIELYAGTCFVFNKLVKVTSIISIVFLASAVVIVLLTNFSEIVNNIPELFVLNASPTDIFLHLIYILALIFILQKVNKKD